MKITISTGAIVLGGAERVISILSKELVDLGHTVELLLYYDRPLFYEIDPRVKIVSDESQIGERNPIKHIIWRRKYIKKSSPDVVVSFLAVYNMINIIAMLGLRKPHIVADRNDPRYIPGNVLIRKIRDFLYCFADKVVVQGQHNKDYFSKFVQKKSTIIFNPVEVGENLGVALKTRKASKIVYVGRIIEQKRLTMILDAFNYIKDEFPEYQLVFYGDGAMKGAIQENIREYELQDRVSLPGTVTNVVEEIKDATLFVLTSDYEGMPNSLLEAMCIGLPVISTKVAGATDIINNEINGLLIDCRSTEQLITSMRRMLTDESFRNKCSENAVAISKVVETDVIINKWIELISSIKNNK